MYERPRPHLLQGVPVLPAARRTPAVLAPGATREQATRLDFGDVAAKSRVPPLRATPAVLAPGNESWKPWSLPVLGALATPTPPVPSALFPVAAPTVDVQVQRMRAFEKECSRIRAKAQEEGRLAGLQEGRAEGHVQGFAQGRQEGIAQARAEGAIEQAQIQDQIADMAIGLNDEIVRLQEEIGQAIVHMGVRIATHVVMNEVRAPQASLIALVKDALAHSEHHEGLITLRVHPDDVSLVTRDANNIVGRAELRVVPDHSLMRGDLKVKTKWGNVDATWQSRLNQALAAIGYPNEPLPAVPPIKAKATRRLATRQPAGHARNAPEVDTTGDIESS